MSFHKLGLPTGVGVGLRSCHYPYIETKHPTIPWFEVLSDNYLCEGGPSLYHLEKIRAAYPMTLHGVGMSLGSTTQLNQHYLKKLRALIKLIEPLVVSDHLCWTALGDQHFHELLPLPYTQEAIHHIASRIRIVQEFLEQRIMIENVSSYLSFTHSTLTEWQFLQAVAEEADCLILLDINNIYVSAKNNHFNPDDYLTGLTTDRIAQFHLAGFEDHGTYLLDTHSAPISTEVLTLFTSALRQFGAVPTILEWDKKIPDFEQLQQEAVRTQQWMDGHVIVG
jgi:uncharacterized protein